MTIRLYSDEELAELSVTLDGNALRRLLCERLCEEVCVDERPDGGLMVRTHFSFPDGDGYPFHLAEARQALPVVASEGSVDAVG